MRSGRLMHACIQHDAGCWRLSLTKTNFHLAIEPPRWWPEEPLAPPPARSRLQRKCGRNDSHRMSVSATRRTKVSKKFFPAYTKASRSVALCDVFFLQRRLRRHNHLCIFPPSRIIARSHRAREEENFLFSEPRSAFVRTVRATRSLSIFKLTFFAVCALAFFLGIYTDECGFSSHASLGA